MCTYVYTHTQIHLHTHTQTHAHTHTYTYTHVHTHTHLELAQAFREQWRVLGLGLRMFYGNIGHRRHANTPMLEEFPKTRVPYLGFLMIRILLFRVLYKGPLFSETPIRGFRIYCLRGSEQDLIWMCLKSKPNSAQPSNTAMPQRLQSSITTNYVCCCLHVSEVLSPPQFHASLNESLPLNWL